VFKTLHGVSSGQGNPQECRLGISAEFSPDRLRILPSNSGSSLFAKNREVPHDISIASARPPVNSQPHCLHVPRTLTAAALKVSLQRRKVRLMSERDLGGNMAVTRSSMSTAVRQGFGPPHVRRWIEFVLTLGAARGHFVARANENRTRDDGPNRLGAAFAAALVWTPHPPAGPCMSSRVFKRQHARHQLLSVSGRRR
jgi:hypothetical protein